MVLSLCHNFQRENGRSKSDYSNFYIKKVFYLLMLKKKNKKKIGRIGANSEPHQQHDLSGNC